MDGQEVAKINFEEVSTKQKFYLGVLMNAKNYHDRKLLKPMVFPNGYIERHIAVSAMWSNHILYELIDNKIIVGGEAEDEHLDYEYHINCSGTLESNEKLYDDLLNPEITECNLNEMISIFKEDITYLGVEMTRDIFHSRRYLYDFSFGPLREGRNGHHKDAMLMKDIFVKIGKVIEKEITVDKNSNINTIIDEVKKYMNSIYDEMYQISDEVKQIIGYHKSLEYNAYTAMVSQMIGREYRWMSSREFYKLPPFTEDWDKID